jgi:hypothetical protein
MLEETSTKIYAHDARQGDSFGTSVSLYDNTALIGASLDDESASFDSGSVYIFTRAPSPANASIIVWTEETKLRASDATKHAAFGQSVSLYDNTALIGARYDKTQALGAGSVYVFQRTYSDSNSASWTEQTKLFASDFKEGHEFGVSVSLYDNTALVGALKDDDEAEKAGAVYVFARSSEEKWTQASAKLYASDANAGDFFGSCVSLFENTALIGAYLQDDGEKYAAGSVYAFTRTSISSLTWTQQETKLRAPLSEIGGYFGVSVSLYGDSALIGAHGKDDVESDAGVVYVFTRSPDGSSWTHQLKLSASDAAENDHFGISVSLYGTTALIGARFDDDKGVNAGRVYVFEASSAPAAPSPPPPRPEFYLVLDGVQAHWDASDLSSLNDGATLSSSDWVDKSGNERGALAPLGTVTYQATGLSDTYPCLYLSGSSTGLDTGGGTNYVRQTIVMVFRWDECNCLGTCGNAVHYLWDWRDEWGLSYLHGNHHNSGSSSGPWQNGARWINAEVKNNFDTNQCAFFQGTTYHATEPIVMIWEAESPNTGDDMTLFATYQNSENVRAQVAEIQIYDSSLSKYDRQSLECGLAEKWGISDVSAKCEASPPLTQSEMLETMYEDDDGWLLLLAYNHLATDESIFTSGKPPQSPTEGNSHVWLNDLGLTANDVESVRFYCKTSKHNRVVHFSVNNDWIKSVVTTGSASGNSASYWTSGNTKFGDHTAYIPDEANYFSTTDLLSWPFYKGYYYHWSIGGLDTGEGNRWECDDMVGRNSLGDTTHQIWFKKKRVLTAAEWNAQYGSTIFNTNSGYLDDIAFFEAVTANNIKLTVETLNSYGTLNWGVYIDGVLDNPADDPAYREYSQTYENQAIGDTSGYAYGNGALGTYSGAAIGGKGEWAMIKYSTPQTFTGLKMTPRNGDHTEQYVKSFTLEFS